LGYWSKDMAKTTCLQIKNRSLAVL